MTEKTKKDHLNFKHQGQEEKYQNKCILCKRKVEARKKNASKGGDINMKISEKVKMKDKFGK
jgi:hypothetical protein